MYICLWLLRQESIFWSLAEVSDLDYEVYLYIYIYIYMYVNIPICVHVCIYTQVDK